MFLANTDATVVADMEFWFGTPTDLAFGGDPDGDGSDSVFLYRPSSGSPISPTPPRLAPTMWLLLMGPRSLGYPLIGS
jgi:hypothetical protein